MTATEYLDESLELLDEIAFMSNYRGDSTIRTRVLIDALRENLCALHKLHGDNNQKIPTR